MRDPQRWRRAIAAATGSIVGAMVLVQPGQGLAAAAASSPFEVVDLQVNNAVAAAGVAIDEAVRFSWRMDSEVRGISQEAFQVHVHDGDRRVWSSGEVTGRGSVAVPFDVSGLEPEAQYTWSVDVTSSTGVTASSKPATFVTEADFSDTDWIIPAEQANGISLLRTEQPVQRQVESATLFASAMGSYTPYIDGQKVSSPGREDILNPGFTDYNAYVNYQSFDVTDLVRDRSLSLAFELSKGWYAGRVGTVGNYKAAFGPDDNATELGLIAKLVLRYADGTTQVIDTDDTWSSSDHSPVLANDLWDGENYDARIAREIDGWNDDGYDVSGWGGVAAGEYRGDLRASNAAMVRYADELDRPAVEYFTYADDETLSPAEAGNDFGAVTRHPRPVAQTVTLNPGEKLIVDFGQNAAGVLDLTVNGAEGTRVTTQHAEMLNDGRKNPTVASGGSDGPSGTLYLTALGNLKTATDNYYLSDEGAQTWRADRTFHGFQYAQITADKKIQVRAVVAKTMTSVGESTGEIITNDEDINQLYSNTKWSQVSNYLSIPTDCPQRAERAGWTGDAQLFAATALYHYDVQGFLESYNDVMQQFAADNQGRYGAIMPASFLGFFATTVASGWSDAGVIIPWILYQQSGDTSLIEQYYGQMDEYMDWVHANGYAGNVFGDWLAFSGATVTYMNAVYKIYVTGLMADMAEAVGDSAMKAKYDQRHDELEADFHAEWMDEAGNVLSGKGTKTGNQVEVIDNSQTGLLWALKLGLFRSEAEKDVMVSHLVRNIRNKDGAVRAGHEEDTLSVGFLGVNVLLPVLSDIGEDDVAYDLLMQDAMPSWLYSVKNGATTMWERWNSYSTENSFGDSGMNSFNHYSYGAVSEWLYKYAAGIAIDESRPGFQHFVLQPRVDVDGRLDEFEGSYDSPYGEIRSKWTSANGRMDTYRAVVPANTDATMYLPVSENVARTIAEHDGVTFEGMVERDGHTVASFALVSGSYVFTDLDNAGPVDPVLGTITVVKAPSIKGKAVVGHKLKAAVGSVTPAATVAYQWLHKGQVIEGATGKKLKLKKKYRGKVRVQITYSAPGHAPLTVSTKAVKVRSRR